MIGSQAGADDTQQIRRSSDDDDSQSDVDTPPSLPRVGVVGDFTDRLSAITESSMSVIVQLGRTSDGEAVLLPSIDLKMIGSPSRGDEPFAMLECLLTIENVAYLQASLTSDLASAIEQVAAVAEGGVRLEPVRTRHTLDYLKNAALRLAEAIGTLEKVLPDAEQ